MYTIHLLISLIVIPIISWGCRENILPGPIIRTVAGNGSAAYCGDGGAALEACLDNPLGVSLDKEGRLYIADNFNGRIRMVEGGKITTVAGCIVTECSDEDGVPAVNALDWGGAVEVGPDGWIYLPNPIRIRKFTVGGIITTVAGVLWPLYSGQAPDDGLRAIDVILGPSDIAFDPQGDLLIANGYISPIIFPPAILKVDSNGLIWRISGKIAYDDSGDEGPVLSATFRPLISIAVGPNGDIYVASGIRIRRISPDGIVHAFAGTEVPGFYGDGGPAVMAQVNFPTALTVDGAGNVYFADSWNHRIRKIAVDTGIITTVAGNGKIGPWGDGGLALEASLCLSFSLSMDFDSSRSRLYFPDSCNNKIRAVQF